MSDQYQGPEWPQQPQHQQQPGYPYQQMPMQPPRKRRTWLVVLLSITGAFIVMVGGCVAFIGSAVDDAKDPTKVTATDPTADPTAGDAPFDPSAEPSVPDTEPPAVPETSEPPAEDEIAKVGASQWFTYEDGLKVQVTKLTKYTIGQSGVGGKPGGTAVIVTVTIKNTSRAKFDAKFASVNLLAGPNGEEAEEVYDSARFETGYDGSIAPGKSGTARWGFAVAKSQLKQLMIEVTPSWDHDGATFEGSLK